MNTFNRYQLCATISIAIFIVSFSICVLSRDRRAYRISVDNYFESLSDSEYVSMGLKREQLVLCYDILADEVTSFKGSGYEVPGFVISAENIDRLKRINTACRAAWMTAVISFVAFIYCFILLSRRRLYMPLAYGSAFATLITSILALVVLLSKNPLLKGIKNMILYRNYSYFVEGDIVRSLFVPNFARILIAEFLIIECIVIMVFVIANYLIKRSGRPHEF